MIKGLTHDVSTGVRIRVAKYKGKISTGYAPNEGPNKKNAPTACGFFRMLKEVVRQSRATSGTATQTLIKEWALNEEVQELLMKSNNNNVQPRRLQFISLYPSPDEMWESSLAMYGSEGLLCKSHGEGTQAKFLTFEKDDKRVWITREFNGTAGCPYRECPDFIAGKCKPIGLMKVHPQVDMEPNPYRFETRSINTIMGIESQINDLFALTKASHVVRSQEQGKPLPFDGLFGAKLELRHRKIMSGGREVFITDLLPSKEFAESLMNPIRRGIERNNLAALSASGSPVSLLQQASQAMLEDGTDEVENVDTLDSPVPLDQEDEQAIATQFSNPESNKENQASPSAAEAALLDK